MSYIKTNWVDGTTPVSAVNMNKIESGIENITAFSKFPTATGTGTAIIINAPHFTLSDGESITFIASANNGGNNTTINVNGLGAKNLFIPGTPTSPNMISGKSYTVWYSLSADRFFIKASAEGDAIATDVLAGKKFSNDNDTGITGTYGNFTAGLTSFLVVDGNNKILYETSYTQKYQIQFNRARGTVRIIFDLSADNGYISYARIYKNGVAVGTPRTATSYASYSEDISFVENDIIVVKAYCSNSGKGSIGQFYVRATEDPQFIYTT